MADAGNLFIENTIRSMQMAMQYGARGLALDVRRTADGQLVVYRDATLDCRTNGRGRVADHTLAQLRALDAGYGYTPDNGDSFPLRGRGIGAIPSVDEVLVGFRNQNLVFIFREGDPAAAEAMAAALRRTRTQPDQRIGFVGPAPVLARMRALAPGGWTFERAESEACLTAYRGTAWTGFVPDECRGRMVALTLDTDWRLWGWPYRFYARMAGAGGQVTTASGFDAEGVPIGLTSAEQFAEVPRNFRGWLWVEDMTSVGRALVR
jgi:glycerophosphoryl diester phosphodiesterase